MRWWKAAPVSEAKKRGEILKEGEREDSETGVSGREDKSKAKGTERARERRGAKVDEKKNDRHGGEGRGGMTG